jgi:MFS family permease
MVASGFRSAAGPMVHASAMITLGALPAFLLSAQAVLIRDELEFDEVSLGLLVGSFFGAAAVTAVLSGSFIDALGRRRSTVLAGLTAGSGGLLLASSARPSRTCSSPWSGWASRTHPTTSSWRAERRLIVMAWPSA